MTDPPPWATFLAINWRAADTVEVAHSHDVTFLARRDSVGPLHIRYGHLP